MPLVSRHFPLFALISHALAAGVAAILLARGFPPTHLRFWVNQILPVLILLACLAGIIARWKKRETRARRIIAALAGAWVASAMTAFILFPASGRFAWLLAFIVGALISASVAQPWRRLLIPAAIGALAGIVVPFAERAPTPDTRPLNLSIPTFDSDPNLPTQTSFVLGQSVRVRPATGAVTLQRGSVVVTIHPLLTFESRSPDRCWTNLAPRHARIGPGRSVTALRREPDTLQARYQDDGLSQLSVAVAANDETTIEAFSTLPAPIYSHLNSFAEIFVAGHKRLFVSFSPCPAARIELLPEDYPFGRLGRCAYLDPAGIFHIVQASSGEKGPFHELASGPLARTDPLLLTLYDNDHAIATITLEDWPAQTATQLSPTAGWRLPANAIEFNLEGDAPASPATFFITLAASSVGRGWDSVGHAAGTYRNRMRIAWSP